MFMIFTLVYFSAILTVIIAPNKWIGAIVAGVIYLIFKIDGTYQIWLSGDTGDIPAVIYYIIHFLEVMIFLIGLIIGAASLKENT